MATSNRAVGGASAIRGSRKGKQNPYKTKPDKNTSNRAVGGASAIKGSRKGNQNLEKKTPNESSNRGEWGSGAIRGEGGKGSGSVGPYGKNKRNKGAAPERTGSNASKAKTGRGNWI
tara:strand:- start:165 stop:515 length:351 start_codon:yes stop_codon:yes gene_type:complete